MEGRGSGFGIRSSGTKAWGCRLWEVLCLTFVVITARPALASQQSNEQVKYPSQISVRVYNYAEVPRKVLSSSVEEARNIFQKAGIESLWIMCRAGGTPQKHVPLCERDLSTGGITLKILSASMAARLGAHWEHLGFALSSKTPGAGLDAWVFYHRVEELARFRIADRSLILGAAMAHEIGHLLLGPKAHSPSGIMRGKWHRQELELAAQGYLLFTVKESKEMRDAASIGPQQPSLTELHSATRSQASLAQDRY